MFVTLEVSQLSGWLNADAYCQVEGRGMQCGARCGPGKAGEGVRRWRRKRHARGGPDSRLLGARARAERTVNMFCMFVTLEVSQLEMSALKFFNLWKR